MSGVSLASRAKARTDGVCVSIIVPTLNESENLPALLRRIEGAMVGWSYEVLIIDDDSRDGTMEFCRQLITPYHLLLHVRHVPIGGLSGAVLEGLGLARGRFAVVMDADLQHPPESIPSLVTPLLTSKADFVIGSRSVRGGTVSKEWGWNRRVSSIIGRLLVMPLAGSVRDPMSGFFAICPSSVVGVPSLQPIGFKIGLELLCKCRFRKVLEVPIAFGARVAGRSKFSSEQRRNYLRHVSSLYWYRFCGSLLPSSAGCSRMQSRHVRYSR